MAYILKERDYFNWLHGTRSSLKNLPLYLQVNAKSLKTIIKYSETFVFDSQVLSSSSSYLQQNVFFC